MAWRAYDYTSRRHRVVKKAFYRPLIDIDVYGETGPETFTALIDSGSETTVMSAEIAQLVGISPLGKKKTVVASLGASSVGFIAPVRIVVPEFPKEILTTNVIFADDVSTGVPYDILLGQEDFFRRFLVKFDKSKNKFFLDIAR